MQEVGDILHNNILVIVSPDKKIYTALFAKKILGYWHKVRQKKIKTTGATNFYQ